MAGHHIASTITKEFANNSPTVLDLQNLRPEKLGVWRSFRFS